MNKRDVVAYFDHAASLWDKKILRDDKKIEYILDCAGIKEYVTVLDVACGTGVLFPYYLKRNVSRVLGVDISPEMTRIAATKMHDPRIEVVCGDMETLESFYHFDCCVVYNAFPHFTEPSELIKRLSQWLKPQGRLTVAHSMSLEALRKHHSGSARSVSMKMINTEEMEKLFSPFFDVDIALSDEEKYIVTGIKRSNEKCEK